MWKGLLWEGDAVGLYYMRGRWYDPELGRFIQEDPIHSGVNDYAFAGDDPVNGADPSGACPFEQMIIAIDTHTGNWTATCPGGGGSASGTLGVSQLPPVSVTGPAASPAPVPAGPGNSGGNSFGSPEGSGLGGPDGGNGAGNGPNMGSQQAQPIPSCRAVEFPGSHGKISVQTSSQGRVQWGIYMNNYIANDGPWWVHVFVGPKQVDGKSFPQQDYAPHGSVASIDAKSGRVFRIDATHTDLFGFTYHSVPNACIIP